MEKLDSRYQVSRTVTPSQLHGQPFHCFSPHFPTYSFPPSSLSHPTVDQGLPFDSSAPNPQEQNQRLPPHATSIVKKNPSTGGLHAEKPASVDENMIAVQQKKLSKAENAQRKEKLSTTKETLGLRNTNSDVFIDPSTEPNFIAMQNTPLPETILQWWKEPASESLAVEHSPNEWMKNYIIEDVFDTFQSDTEKQTLRENSVDAQVSPKTQAIPLPELYRGMLKSSGLMEKCKDFGRYQPPLYTSTNMPTWSRNWTINGNEKRNHDTPEDRSIQSSQCDPRPVDSRHNQEQDPVENETSMPIVVEQPRESPEIQRDTVTPQAPQQSQSVPEKAVDVVAPVSHTLVASRNPPSPNVILDTGNLSSIDHTPSVERTQQAPPATTINPFDNLRRPSLYNIPAWSPTDKHSMENESREPLAPHSYPNPPSTSSSRAQGRQVQSDIHYPTTNRKGARRFAPNLIVDIAETCQQVFPFEMIAQRHEVSVQKVYDTFTAIIQIPLLRNADDKRRHGSLGKRRMKEFRDARKAMEREKLLRERDAMNGRGAKRGYEGGSNQREKRMRPAEHGRDGAIFRQAVTNNANARLC